MQVQQYIILLKRWLWLVVLGGAIAAGVAFAVSKSQTPIYRATSLLLISEGSTPNSNSNYGSLTSLAHSYIERLTNYEVLTDVIDSLGLTMSADDLRDAIHVRVINDTELISLSVENRDPQIAAALANEIPQRFAERNMRLQLERYDSFKVDLEDELTQVNAELANAVATLTAAQNNGNEQLVVEQLTDNVIRLRETHSRLLQSYGDVRIAEAGNLNNLVIDEHARVPKAPISPRIVSNTLLAGVVGVMVAVGLVFLIEYLDDTIKDPNSLAQITDLSTIGLIAESPFQSENEPLIMMAQPRSPNAEAYRQLRTNVQYVGVSRPLSTILVTSPNAAEGKSTTAANLAIALVQADNRVVLVDGDMRRPFLHHKFGMSNTVGLTNLLLSGEDDAAFVQETAVPNLRLITSGPLPPNPAELIHSDRMKHLIEWLGETADYIVIDSPPVLAVTDSVLLSQLASTTLMVAEAGKTRQQSLLLALQQIEAVGGHLAGILINKINRRRSGYYYNYYSYYTNYQTHDSSTPRPKRKSKLGESLSSLFML